MKGFQTKNLYLKNNSNFDKSHTSNSKPKLIKKSPNLILFNNKEKVLSFNENKKEKINKEKHLNKIKTKQSQSTKSQEKLNKIIKGEENFKKFHLDLIKNKIKEEDIEFNSFLLKTNDISDNETEDEKTKKRIELEEMKIFHIQRNLGKNENNSDDYIKRYNLLFPGEFLQDEANFQEKEKSATIIQQYFRKHKRKKKLYVGFQEPIYLIRIYEYEYDDESKIKSIEIKIYSTLFQKNMVMIKTVEELLGVESISRENIQSNMEKIIETIIGLKKN